MHEYEEHAKLKQGPSLSEIKNQQEEFISMLIQRAVSETAEVCDQCGKCSSICPISKYMEGFNPRRLIAKVFLGKFPELLKSEFLWTCTSCLKCKERCPENISPYDVILILRTLAYRTGYEHPSGYDEFIKKVIENGLANEPQKVRARKGGRFDRESLGLPPAKRPKDKEVFQKILKRMS